MHRLLFTAVLAAMITFSITAQDSGEDTNNDGQADRWVKSTGRTVNEISLDRDYDGKIDYIVKYDDEANKTEEIMDFNYDGEMDDYYFYAKGTMKRREIDSNYDGKIDIWVYLDGIYIEKYEKDIDFDGRIDIVEDYIKE